MTQPVVKTGAICPYRPSCSSSVCCFAPARPPAPSYTAYNTPAAAAPVPALVRRLSSCTSSR